MTLVAIDAGSDVAPYEQVRLQLAAQVATGQIQAGAKLPTVRALAAELGLAVNTVARAYRELEADGVIATEGRRGTFARSSAAGADVRDAAGSFTATARRAGLSLAQATRLVEQAWVGAGRP